MRCGAKCAGVIFNIIGEKHPQMAQIDADVVGQSVGAGFERGTTGRLSGQFNPHL